MLCRCGSKPKTTRVALYHYKECGLPNVYLGGTTVAICPKCGERYLVISSVLELFEKISEAVALKPRPLSGPELRFLRKHLGLKAVEWASYMKTDKSTVSRWENQRSPIGRQSDALIRYVYFRLLEEKEGRRIPERISDRITGVDFDGEEVGLKIPSGNPSAYSFPPATELAGDAIG